eukprot:225442-Pleurochrysis_carterae.AAC.1
MRAGTGRGGGKVRALTQAGFGRPILRSCACVVAHLSSVCLCALVRSHRRRPHRSPALSERLVSVPTMARTTADDDSDGDDD